ncbi:hypothetical protein ACFO3K_16980 [Cellulomonas algicola]|uniref:Uncharacterized protein n=1 Tax=Cellulomonas algicola TaxID=2071633 RepID=A0A401V493_9CELL|nr:hypothetical protein [Cellulomonas algicola]GCD21715.1 hypothetical protein CTKZ_32770 [Cellulomonas algicola]
MHPELFLTLHQQQQRELDRALAVALLVRERTTPEPHLRWSRVGTRAADAGRRMVLAARQRLTVSADRSPAACCAA